MPQTHVPSRPILCYVTGRASLPGAPGESSEAALLARIRDAACAGVDWIELREKDLGPRDLLALARGAAAAMPPYGRARTKLLINDRLDVALAAGADGVHLPESGAPIQALAEWQRRAGPPGFLVGASCHSLPAAERAEQDGAAYVFFGPVFETPSKAAFGAPQGLAKLAAVCRALKIPVLAIGGIREETAGACLRAGAAGIAAIGMFQRSADLPELLVRLRA